MLAPVKAGVPLTFVLEHTDEGSDGVCQVPVLMQSFGGGAEPLLE